ncbi:MAG: hypothetical protein R3336_03305 [Phycisphaeraceae bacterium]|nr:hypothetical protein [Phycisphaeraceae bacterium]
MKRLTFLHHSFLLAILLTGVIGCVSQTVVATDTSPPALRPSGPVDGPDLLPRTARRARMIRSPDGDPESKKASSLLRRRYQTEEGAWRVSTGDQVDHLVLDEAATLVKTEIVPGDKVRTVYKPAIPIIPARLKPDQPVEGEVDVTIYNLKGGGVKEKGTCRYRIELLGRRTITTPAGKFEAVLVRTHRQFDLNLAEAEVTLDTHYLVDRGIVHQKVHRITRPLGLFKTEKIYHLHLGKELPPEEESAPAGETDPSGD